MEDAGIIADDQFNRSVVIHIAPGDAVVDDIIGHIRFPEQVWTISRIALYDVVVAKAPVRNDKVQLAIAVGIQQGRSGLYPGIGIHFQLPNLRTVFAVQAEHITTEFAVQDLGHTIVVDITDHRRRVASPHRCFPLDEATVGIEAIGSRITAAGQHDLEVIVHVHIGNEGSSIGAATHIGLPEHRTIFTVQHIQHTIVPVRGEHYFQQSITIHICSSSLAKGHVVHIELPEDLRLCNQTG